MTQLHLQLAFDRGSLEGVCAMARRAAPHVDTIEVGTPLLMREGVAALRQMRDAIDGTPAALFADTKISDEGIDIAHTCFEAGADALSVVDGASFETLYAVRAIADEVGRQVWVDLLNHSNPIVRARALAPFVDGFILHRMSSGLPPMLVAAMLSLRAPVRLAGGLTPSYARRAVAVQLAAGDRHKRMAPMEGIIVGRAITEAEDFDGALATFVAICGGELAESE